MPNKHIPEDTWYKVEKETYKAIIELKTAIKETKMLNWIILRGLKNIEPEEYYELKERK